MKIKKLSILSCMIGLVILLGAAVPAWAQTPVIIDIKPCKEPDVLNVNVIGWLPVAIYGNEAIQPDDIDPGSVTLMGVPATEWFMRGDYLLVKFNAMAVIDELGQVSNGEVVTLFLEGLTTEGEFFTGADQVAILKRGKR